MRSFFGTIRRDAALAFAACALAWPATNARAGGPGVVLDQNKISDTAGGFGGGLTDGANFGAAVATIGDLNGDDLTDIAVGARNIADGGIGHGAVYIVFLDGAGSVVGEQKISATDGDFQGVLDDDDRFGWSVTAIGDLDEDGVVDLAVGAIGDDDGDANTGAVWILFMNNDGTVKAHQKISATEGGFTGAIDATDALGSAVVALGDLDNDGVEDIAATALGDDDGGSNRGAIWILFLNADGTVKAHQKISATEGGFTGAIEDRDGFGIGMASIGDLDGDGTVDIAVGSNLDEGNGGFNRGAMYIIFLNADGTVKGHSEIGDGVGGFTGDLANGDLFGTSVGNIGDIDGDCITDLAVGALFDGDGGPGRGAVWILLMNTDGTVKSFSKISDTDGGFTGSLDDTDNFSRSIAGIGDIDGDNIADLAVGTDGDDDGGLDRGAVYLISLNGAALCPADLDCNRAVGFEEILEILAQWGPCPPSPSCPADIDNSGVVDFADILIVLSRWGDCDPDSDKDGVFDYLDNCPNDANSGQEDLDGDGLGDVCDIDADGDGWEGPLGDGQDCDDLDPLVNPDAEEICTDGIDNDCDTLIDVEDAVDCDIDGDGVIDEDDNCPDTANPGQEDLDDDGVGDVCDVDADGDGWEGPLGTGEDCDDLDPLVNPDAKEICDDGIDNDCDKLIDGEDPDCGG